MTGVFCYTLSNTRLTVSNAGKPCGAVSASSSPWKMSSKIRASHRLQTASITTKCALAETEAKGPKHPTK